jgi:hypothetical protein
VKEKNAPEFEIPQRSSNTVLFFGHAQQPEMIKNSQFIRIGQKMPKKFLARDTNILYSLY